MAVTTTPQDILNMAYSKSMKNKPGTIATESTELLQLVIRAMRGIYAFAARVNPIFFAETNPVAKVGSSWPRPVTAESIFRIENASFAEVILVPFDDRTAESGKPSVYEFAQQFFPAGNTNDPTGTLTFWYSKRPTDPANLTAAVDALWTEQFNELLALEVAIYLAIKDSGSGRDVEVAALKEERDRWVRLFTAFLEHETVNERRRWAHIERFNTKSLVPLGQLLAGGSSAA